MLNNMKALVGLVLILAGFAYFLVSKGDNNSMSGDEVWLLPQLQGDVTGQLTELQISQADEQLVLHKKGQNWFVKDGFYADTAPMMQLLQALRTAQKIEAKTSNPDNFSRLGLGDADVKVSLKTGNDILAAVHLGNKSTTPGASFARLVGENQTWLVTSIDQVSHMSDDWTLRTVIDHGEEEVVKVRIDNGTDSVVAISKNEVTGDWQLEDIPDGKQAKADMSWIQLASGLSAFSIDQALQEDLGDKSLEITADYQLADGRAITVKLYQFESDYFATLNLKKYQGWMFKIPKYKFDALNKSMSAIIEDIGTEDMVDVPESVEGSDAQ